MQLKSGRLFVKRRSSSGEKGLLTETCRSQVGQGIASGSSNNCRANDVIASMCHGSGEMARMDRVTTCSTMQLYILPCADIAPV